MFVRLPIALRKSHERQRAAFAIVVSTQQDDVLQRDDDRQRPQDQGQ